MDADILRLILFLAGVGLILGIYFWDRHKKVNARVHAIRKAQLESIEPPDDLMERVDPSWSDAPVSQGEGPEEPIVDRISLGDSDDGGLEAELQQLDSVAHENRGENEPAIRQESFSFTADDPDDAQDELLREGLPGMILQIHVVASKGSFSENRYCRWLGTWSWNTAI